MFFVSKLQKVAVGAWVMVGAVVRGQNEVLADVSTLLPAWQGCANAFGHVFHVAAIGE